jgi:hypothetical protein
VLVRARGLIGGVGVALAILAVVPAGAAARPATTFVEAKLPPSGPFRVFLSGFADQLSINLVTTSANAGYAAQGNVGPRRVSADFEQFGTVDLRFEPRGKPKEGRLPAECDGAFTVQRGTFVGTFSLHAENGLANIEADRLTGKVFRDSVRCGRPESPDEPQNPGDREVFTEVVLEASDSLGSYGSQFLATHQSNRKRIRFEAYRSRQIGNVSTFVGTRALGPPSSFTYDLRNQLATVQPPPPFTGVGQLGRDEFGVPTWTGALATSPFGQVSIPLTGGAFQAALSRYRVVQITHAGSRDRPSAREPGWFRAPVRGFDLRPALHD